MLFSRRVSPGPLPALTPRRGTNHHTIQIVITIAVAVLLGPLVSAMANKLGIREVTIIGSVVASAFFVISSFSANIDMMLVTYGIMGGAFSQLLSSVF